MSVFIAFLGIWLVATPQAAPPVSPPLPDEHAAYWIAALRQNSYRLVRKNAARNLGQIGNRDALPALIEALKDPDFVVRGEAARSLGILGDELAIPALTAVSDSDGDAKVRKVAGDAVQRIREYVDFHEKKKEKELLKTTPPKAAR